MVQVIEIVSRKKGREKAFHFLQEIRKAFYLGHINYQTFQTGC